MSEAVRKTAALLLVALLSVAASRSALPVSTTGPACACCDGVQTACPTPSCCAPQQPAKGPATPTPAPSRSDNEWQIPATAIVAPFTLPRSGTHNLAVSPDPLPQFRAVPIFQRDCSYLI